MIIISDMIHYTDEYNLNNKLDWLYSCCVSGKPIESEVDKKYWWVSQQDVASCLYRLIARPESIPEFLHICGRRGWLITETFDQLKLLFERTIAGATGQFNPTSLEHKPVITQSLTKVDDVIKSSRPDLSLLDDTLRIIDGQRWRPMVPLRTSLMHYLAMKDISHSVWGPPSGITVRDVKFPYNVGPLVKVRIFRYLRLDCGTELAKVYHKHLSAYQ